MTLPDRVAKPPSVLFREVDNEGVLLELESERYFILDDVGARMWQLLAKHGEVSTAVEHLLAEYDVDENLLRDDLARLIAELAEANLITIESS